MNNILIAIKKFFQNKNVVTILGIILILGLLYFGYNRTIKAQTEPIRVPVASQTIQPRTLITDDMITYIEVPGKSVSPNVVKNSRSIVNMYSAINTVIPQGSMFYSDVLVTKEQLPDSAFVAVPDGQRPYNLSVNTQTTYGNSIFPGNVVDVYMKAVDETGQVVVGRLLSQVKILAVKDSNGDPVFSNLEEKKTPAMMVFAVPEEYHILLRKASFLRAYDTTLIPVPTAESLKEEPGEVQISSEDLKNFINSVTVWTDTVQ